MTITSFEPLDEQRLQFRRRHVREETVPFAHSEGDPIFLRPGATRANRVHIYRHDGDETGLLSDDIDAILATITTPRTPP